MKTIRGRARSWARTPVVIGTVAAAVGVGGVLAIAAPQPFHNGGVDGLAAVGPVDVSDTGGGFPIYYRDTNGVRLELCLDANDPYCIPAPLPDPNAPMSFPGNFPDEAFWWAGDAIMTSANGGNALLVLANEAAFATGDPQPGQQISFGRIRIRIDNVPAGEYTVTHPYGVDTFAVDEAAAFGPGAINVTEDIGDMAGGSDFTTALGGRVGPFLTWDPQVEPQPPAGYLGDPAVPHQVVGSPYDTNFFEVRGPAGAFAGSPELCPGSEVTADCIRTDLFNVQAKIATRAGAEANRVDLVDDGGDQFVDVFAFSEPGQDVLVRGTGIGQVALAGDGQGNYFARIARTGGAVGNLEILNTTDQPDTISPLTVGDGVHVDSATYDVETGVLTVVASARNSSALLTLDGFTAGGQQTSPAVFAVETAAPAPFVTVRSAGGSVDSDDVVVTGTPAVTAVEAIAAPIGGTILSGQAITLDGSTSTGPIETYAWVQTSGTSVAGLPSSSAVTSVTLPDVGTYEFSLTVNGPNGASSTASVTVEAIDAPPPLADAGADRTAVVPLTNVTLDGSASQNTTSWTWVQTGGPAVTLNGATTATPSFSAPVDAGPVTFELTASNASGVLSTDTVSVSMNLDDLTLAAASYRSGEWRANGTAEHCVPGNVITLRWNVGGTTTSRIVGSTTPTLAGGACTWTLRVRNVPATLQPTAATQGTVSVTSTLGGNLVNRAYTRR